MGKYETLAGAWSSSNSRVVMAVNKYAVAGGVAVVAVGAIGAGVICCRRDFAEAAAAGDFDRAERRAGLLAVNDIAPSTWLTVMAVIVLCAAWMLFARP
jgi:hypothetical protein